MFEVGLKLWSTNTDHYLHEAERLYVKGVFDYIELFVVPDSVSTLNDWVRLHAERGLPFIIHNAHSATGFNLADAGCAARNREIYAQTKSFADVLEAKHIIFHGGVDGTVDEVVRQLSSFGEPRAIIENKPYIPLPSPQNRKVCRGATYDELKYMLSAIGCGFCLDIGHAVCAANSQGLEPYAYIEKLNTFKPVIYHLSDVVDMASQYDAHPHLGTGRLDIERLCSCVFPVGAKISVETVKDSKRFLDDFSADVRLLLMANQSARVL